jgi:uncharacterized protein YndB with AHSA1/START domain
MKGGHMASVSTSIDIGTAPDQVWDLVTDLDRLGEWVTIHRALHDPAPAAWDGGTRFTYENEFALPGGAVGDAAGGVVASRAGKEAEASLQRLKQLAEA